MPDNTQPISYKTVQKQLLLINQMSLIRRKIRKKTQQIEIENDISKRKELIRLLKQSKQDLIILSNEFSKLEQK